MSVKTILLGSLLLLAVAGVIKTASKNTQQLEDPKTAPSEGKLKWFAHQAKARGQRQAIIPARVPEYAGSSSATDIADAAAAFSIVVAQPIIEQADASNPDTIVTWYKFKVLETLSEHDSPPCPQCLPLTPPDNLLPLKADEFLLVKNGGELTIDGVRVRMIDADFPAFELEKKYLLFISTYPSGVATIGIGPRGIFKVNDDETLEAINDLPHPVKDALLHRFNKSMSEFKQHLRNSAVKH